MSHSGALKFLKQKQPLTRDIVISHRRAGVLCLHRGGLLHLAGGLCLRLQGRERQGGFGGCAHG